MCEKPRFSTDDAKLSGSAALADNMSKKGSQPTIFSNGPAIVPGFGIDQATAERMRRAAEKSFGVSSKPTSDIIRYGTAGKNAEPQQKSMRDTYMDAAFLCPTITRNRLPSGMSYEEMQGHLPEWMTEADVERDRARFAEKAKEQEARFKATLKELKSRGYLAETTWSDFVKKAMDMSDTALRMHLTPFPEYHSACTLAFKAKREEIIQRAIETYVYEKAPACIMNKNLPNFAALCEKNIVSVYKAVFEVMGSYAVESIMAQYDEASLALEKKLDSKENELRKIKQKSKDERKNKESAGIRDLQSKFDAARADLERKTREIEKLGQKLAALENENARLKQAAEDAKKSNAQAAAEKVVQAEETTQKESEKSSDLDLDNIEIPPFPENGVYFVGGHKNLINKLRVVHPNWIYIAPDDTRKLSCINTTLSNANALILFHKHTSHSIWETVKGNLPDDIPHIYVDNCNLEKIDEQIADGWIKEIIRVARKTMRN